MAVNRSFFAESEYLTEQYRNKYAACILHPENLTVYKQTAMVLADDAAMELSGKLLLGAGTRGDYFRSTILRMDAGSRLIVPGGRFSVYYGGDIVLFRNAVLTLGSGSFINSNCSIRCGTSIAIGEDCAISHEVSILDSDFHCLIIDGEEMPRNGSGVVIGNHVWIGVGAKILKNVHIGDGAVIAAGAVVTKDVPARALVAGQPAKVIRTDVDWKL